MQKSQLSHIHHTLKMLCYRSQRALQKTTNQARFFQPVSYAWSGWRRNLLHFYTTLWQWEEPSHLTHPLWFALRVKVCMKCYNLLLQKLDVVL